MQESKKNYKSEIIAKKLRNSILLEKKYRPGDRLPDERTMADMFGVSRTSIREALKTLDAEGLIDVKKARGIFVSSNPGVNDDPLGMKGVIDRHSLICDWYSARLALEPGIVKMVVDNASDDEIEEIINLEKEEADMIKRGEKDFLNVDRRFHLKLAEISHNEVMRLLIPSVQQSFYYSIAGSEYEGFPEKLEETALQSHRRIVEFIEKRDAEGAMLAMRYHLIQALEDVEIINE